MSSSSHNLQLYDHLLRFQLFQGLSRAELLQMAGNTKFGFLKMPAGKTLEKAGNPCSRLSFLISGQLTLSTQSDDGGYCVVEQLSAPWLIQPEVLFGSQTRFTGTWQTQSECHFITLSKDEVMRLLDDFLIIRLNLLNQLSTLAQRRAHLSWRRAPQTLRERIVRFFVDHSTYPAGSKQFLILMTRLADEVGDSRLKVSHVLNQMQTEGQISLHRGRIEVPLLESLLM
ncbi:MAG: Crp/Fnr family transcriptional regulator [Prevotella sp.]|nr:Crp/Fnr family transcriptional regulator [Prevotella sp.]